jgi:hypothetical protein
MRSPNTLGRLPLREFFSHPPNHAVPNNKPRYVPFFAIVLGWPLMAAKVLDKTVGM